MKFNAHIPVYTAARSPCSFSGYSTATHTVTAAQIAAGETVFNNTGCVVCHKKSMQTGNHLNAALRMQTVNLFSDLILHDIGTGDDIVQGDATGAQFRTAPLWVSASGCFSRTMADSRT